MHSDWPHINRSSLRIFKLVLIAFVAAILIRTYIIEGIYPASESMEPTLFKDKYYLLEKVTLKIMPVKRGDILVFPSPVRKNHDLIKRVIAVAGDKIEIIKKDVFLNGVKLEENYAKHTRPNELLHGDDLGPLVVPEGDVFVMGDNRDESKDARDWVNPENSKPLYFIATKDIKGKVEAAMSGTYNPVLKTVVAGCGKTVFKPGDAAQTSVTASLSDDSFLNVSKLNVIYKSSNPSVASVNINGNVKAISSGAASISASVTVDGKTVSNSYPVKVMPNLNPTAITVDGKNIEGFDKGVKAYSYLLSSNSKIPSVKASAESSDIKVSITQAKGIPGTAVIKFIDNVTLEENNYYLNFDVNSTSDEFNDGVVGKQWKWLRPNPAAVSLSKKPGSLTITSEAGDVSEASNNAKNILLQSANNDWTIETKLVCSRVPSQPENAGILAYENDDNFVKLMFRAVIKTTNTGRGGPESQAGTIDLIYEEKGITKSVGTFNLRKEIIGDNNLILKLEKKGSLYTAYYSLDGTKYEKLGTADILLKDIKVLLAVALDN